MPDYTSAIIPFNGDTPWIYAENKKERDRGKDEGEGREGGREGGRDARPATFGRNSPTRVLPTRGVRRGARNYRLQFVRAL
jgi:ribosomal protein L15